MIFVLDGTTISHYTYNTVVYCFSFENLKSGARTCPLQIEAQFFIQIFVVLYFQLLLTNFYFTSLPHPFLPLSYCLWNSFPRHEYLYKGAKRAFRKQLFSGDSKPRIASKRLVYHSISLFFTSCELIFPCVCTRINTSASKLDWLLFTIVARHPSLTEASCIQVKAFVIKFVGSETDLSDKEQIFDSYFVCQERCAYIWEYFDLFCIKSVHLLLPNCN